MFVCLFDSLSHYNLDVCFNSSAAILEALIAVPHDKVIPRAPCP